MNVTVSKTEEKSDNPTSVSTATIMVIDDEKEVLKVSRAMLERLGYSVLTAETGRDAVCQANDFNGHIDLALMDIHLPDMEASNLYTQLRQFCPDLKIVFCSGFSENRIQEEIAETGADDFLQKPFTMSELSYKLNHVLAADCSLEA